MDTNASVLSYEMNKINVDAKWHEQVEAQKAEIAELSAQLARCVLQRDESMGWNWIDGDVPEDTVIYCTQDTLDTAKADAEVLRCADKIHEEYFYGNDDEKALRHNRLIVRNLHNAVRAAREAIDNG